MYSGQGMIRFPGGMDQGDARFGPTSQGGMQFKTWVVYLWSFPFHIFEPHLTSGN
jgi:hypothetical protein